MIRPAFDGRSRWRIAIGAGGEARTQADREARKPPQIGRDLIFLHSGIHENIERPQDDQIEEPKVGNNHIFGPAEPRENRKAVISAPASTPAIVTGSSKRTS